MFMRLAEIHVVLFAKKKYTLYMIFVNTWYMRVCMGQTARKNGRCRAARHCRASSAWQRNLYRPMTKIRTATKECTVKNDKRQKRTAKVSARQRGNTAHGKQKVHGKANEMRTAKNPCTSKKKRHCCDHPFAVSKVRALPLPCVFIFSVRLVAFSSFSFLLYLF